MKWLAGLIALAVLGGVMILWEGDPPDEEQVSGEEGLKRKLKSQWERRLEEVRSKATRALNPSNAQSKIEDFLNANGSIREWDQETVREFNRLAYHWGVLDPEGAMAYVGSLNGPADLTKRERLTAQILRAWGLVDYKAALAWFEEPGQEREKGSSELVNVVQGMFGADPKAVDEFLLGLPEEEELVNWTYIDRVARMHFLNNGLEAATKWAREFPNEKIKKRAIEKIADDLAARAPREAAEWIREYAGDPAAKLALPSIAADMIRAEGVAAAEVAKWARDLPPGEGRGDAMAVAVAAWARQEPVEAGEFVESLPKGEEREVVVSRFAPAVGKINPEVAIEWAGTISNQKKQDETMIRTLVQWALVDQEAAKSWMETAEVTPEVREAISESRFFGNSKD